MDAVKRKENQKKFVKDRTAALELFEFVNTWVVKHQLNINHAVCLLNECSIVLLKAILENED